MWVYSHAAFNFMLEIDYMFYSDRPINSGNEDKLNRKGFARLLARTLVNLDSKEMSSITLMSTISLLSCSSRKKTVRVMSSWRI